MFSQLLAPANPVVVRTWRVWTGVTTGAQGVASVSALVARLQEIIPKEMILENFTYMALAIAFVSGLPLYIFPRVLSVSVAELGVATSAMYLGYSLTGVFQPDYNIVIAVLLIIVAIVFFLLFSGGIIYLYQGRYWSDLVVASLGLIAFGGLWLYPILRTLL